jgi:hypothetical protein
MDIEDLESKWEAYEYNIEDWTLEGIITDIKCGEDEEEINRIPQYRTELNAIIAYVTHKYNEKK